MPRECKDLLQPTMPGEEVLLQLARKIGLPWLLQGVTILVRDVRLTYVPKKLEPVASHPTGSEAGFSLACTLDIPAINALGVKMALVVPTSSSTEKLYLAVTAI